MKQTLLLSILISSILLFSCGSATEQKSTDCPVPPPEAIFNKKLAIITSQSFSIQGRNSKEDLQFVNGTEVSILQSGCEKISQEYRFRIKPASDKSKVVLAIEQMMFLAKLDDAYMSFGNWANAISELKAEFATQNTVQVEPGFYVSLDKIDSSDHSMLTIRLFQQ